MPPPLPRLYTVLMVQTLPFEKKLKYPLALPEKKWYYTTINNKQGLKQMPNTQTMPHNACSVPHFNVSYWIAVDRGDFDVTDSIGEFSIIDPAFQLETYGTYLQSDFIILRNYALRRVFCEFEEFIPLKYHDIPHSFSVLRAEFATCVNKSSLYHCRCYFNDHNFTPSREFSPIDFEISLTIEGVIQKERKNK